MMGEGWHVNGPVGIHMLACEECGEKTVLHGPLSVWCSRGTSFGCECGERLTLADGLDQKGFGERDDATNAAPPHLAAIPLK